MFCAFIFGGLTMKISMHAAQRRSENIPSTSKYHPTKFHVIPSNSFNSSILLNLFWTVAIHFGFGGFDLSFSTSHFCFRGSDLSPSVSVLTEFARERVNLVSCISVFWGLSSFWLCFFFIFVIVSVFPPLILPSVWYSYISFEVEIEHTQNNNIAPSPLVSPLLKRR